MKIKRIEISAFRIYDNPKDGTFDFSTPDGEVADFVSIYAPNGFGKTSFYDAVEWCMTNNIQRFWQHEDITEQAIDALNSNQNNRKVWRHTDSTFETTVKIFDEKNILVRRDLILSNRYKTDAKNNTLENEDFRRVILSQEWISAFLKDINGVDRYKTFMKNPDLEDLATYFKNLKVLLTICNETINEHKKKIAVRNREIKANKQSNLLEQINSTISVLKSLEQEIPSPSLDMNESQVLNFKNKIADEKRQVNPASLDNQIANIQAAKIGTDEIISINKYFDSIESRKMESQKVEAYKTQIIKFEDLAALQRERDNLQTLRAETNQIIEQINIILSVFPEYHRIDQLLSEKTSQLQNFETSRNSLQNKLADQHQLFNKNKNDIEALSKQIENLKHNITNAPVIELEINNEQEWLAILYTGILPIEFLIYEISNELTILGFQKDNYKIAIAQLKNDEFEKINKEIFQEHTKQLEELISLNKKNHELITKLANIESNLSNLESMNSTLCNRQL
ncbi:AAA family ATPase, partial [[Flexibacter] sp. ATCC 35208]|uniref:AAA family ATPase n=1 Tax=[Flexibacter] sp. ATCC 35208 TaxID=1936242 RepID=UPI0009D00F3D